MSFRVTLVLVSAFIGGVAIHYLSPPPPAPPPPAPAPQIDFFTWEARKRHRPPEALVAANPTAQAEPAAEPVVEVELPPNLPSHDCGFVARRAGAIYNLHFVGIPFRPGEGTIERELLQEVAHSRFSNRQDAISFIYQLCSTTPAGKLPLWPQLPPGALKDDVVIENASIQ